MITLIDNDFNSNSDLQITLKKRKRKNLKKYKLYKQIQDPGLNTSSEAFLKYIYIVDLKYEIVPWYVNEIEKRNDFLQWYSGIYIPL